MTQFDTETLANQRFTLEARLGSGSTGTVYAAFDKMRGEKVALKVLTYRSASALYRFKREFRTLVDVVHPNLVAFHELFADDEDEVFFTMELIEGVNVLDHVRPPSRAPEGPGFEKTRFEKTRFEKTRFEKTLLRGALSQFASAVKALHDHDKIHCDLKPNNVLVGHGGRVVILDFGIARDLAPALTPQSLYQGLSGTVPYMAPEQAQGSPPQPESDWYAVGVMLFQALTGRMPFEGSLVDVLSAKVSRKAPSPAELVSDLPRDLVELCTDLLATEPGKRPSGAEVLMRLGISDAFGDDGLNLAVDAAGTDLAVIGRQVVVEALRDAFETSRRGRAVAVYVHGESGLGKTAFVQHILHDFIKTHGAVVLAGRCYERELVPYKALDGVIDSLSRLLRQLGDEVAVPGDVEALCRLFPVLQRVETFAEAVHHSAEVAADRLSLRRRGFAALRELLTGIVAERPLVLYIDDLHWADADSTALLQDLLRAPDPPSLLLLASFRSEEVAAKPFLRDLLCGAGDETCRELQLGPLDAGAAEELTRALLGDMGADLEALVSAIVHEAEGSPFFIEQLVDYARATESSLSSSIGLGEMLDARVGKLPDGAVALLRTLAAAGRPLEAGVACEAAGLEGDERPLVAALKAAHLVRTSGAADHIELFHNRIRETLARRIDAADTQRIHTRLAETLVARGRDDPEALYEHFRHAGQTRRAGRQAARAAAKARAALAFDRAVRFFRDALELGEYEGGERQELLEGLAETLGHAGRPADSAGTYLDLAHSGTQPADRLRTLRYLQKAAEEYLSGGYFDQGLEVVREVGREVGLEVPASRGRALASMFWNRLRLRLRGLSFERREAARIPQEELLRTDACWVMAANLTQNWRLHGNDLQMRHLLFALDSGEPMRVSRALSLESTYRVASGAPPEKTAALRKTALELARSVGDAYAEGLCYLHTGVAAYLAARWREGAQACEEAEDIIRKHGRGGLWGLSQAQRFGMGSRLQLGDLERLCQRVPDLLAEARERGNVLAWTELATRLSVVWLILDNPAAGREALDEALAQRSGEEFHVPHFNVLIGRCQADFYEGGGEKALERITEEWPRLRRSLLLRIALIPTDFYFLQGRAALASAAADRRPDRLRLAEKAATRIESTKAACGPAMATLLRAGAAFLRQDVDKSLNLLEQAARSFDAQEMAFHATVARRRRGELLGGDEGHELVETADAWMTERCIVRPDRMAAVLAPGFP